MATNDIVGKLYAEDPDGALQLKPYNFNPSHTGRSLSNGVKIAIILTDICCHKNQGMVYHLLPHNFKQDCVHRFYAWEAFQAVPELIYTAYTWTQEERDLWQSLGIKDKVHRVCARHGWIPHCTPVLPIDVSYEPKVKKDVIKFSALQASTTTVLFTPFPHVGSTTALRGGCTLSITKDKQNHITHCDYTNEKTKRGKKQWKKFRVDDLANLLDRLEEIWQSNHEKAECIVTYASVVAQILGAGQAAAEAGQSYGTQGRKTIFA